MTKSSSTTTSSGIGFTGVLTIVFIVLKLLGKLDWSWWWVLSPLWISVVILLAIIAGIFVAAFIAEYTAK